jgi:amino acid adenylation domain-containing protein/non-ribosomal peptide synthase protein (TIGR01720 family)
MNDERFRNQQSAISNLQSTMDNGQRTTDNEQFSCVIIGEGSLPLQCAEIVLSHGHTVRGVVSPDTRLARWAAEHGIPHAAAPGDLGALVGESSFDYLFSIVNYQVLSEETLATPRRWAINYHDAPLPRYAGSYATSWALMAREQAHAVTWHLMIGQVDAGAILIQQPIEIAADETALTLNAKCYDAALRSFAALVADLATGRARPQPQDLVGRTFFPRYKRPPAGCALSWNQSADALAAFVRSLQFGPYPNPLGLPKLALDDAFVVATTLDQLSARSGLPPSTIVSIDKDALVVATATVDVALRGLLTIDGQPLTAGDLAARFGLRAGERLPEIDTTTAARLTELYGQLCRHEPFWIDQLAQLQPIGLPYAARPAAASAQRGSYELALPADVATFLDGRADMLLAAFVVYLARLNGRDSFDVGFSEGTLRHEVGNMADFFATMVPLHAALDMRWGFARAAQALVEQFALIRRRRSYARDIVMRYPALRDLPELHDARLWPVVVELQSFPAAWESAPGDEGRELTLQIAHDGSGCRWIYDTSALRSEQVEQMAQQFLTILRGIVARPSRPTAELPLLPEAERHQLLVDWNDTAGDFPRDRCIHELFAAQAARTPDAIAIVFGGELRIENKEQRTKNKKQNIEPRTDHHESVVSSSLSVARDDEQRTTDHGPRTTDSVVMTYREVDRRANQLAHYLQKQGVGVETLVGVYMERSIDLVVGLLAILKAGGAYVPIDPNYPPERIAIMLEDSRAAVLLTEERLAGRLVGANARVVCLDGELRATLAHDPATPPTSTVTSRNLAYVLFTSGSTGRPKGVAIEHRSVAALIDWARQVFTPNDLAGVLFSTSICFDLSIFELFAPLSHGGTAILVENALHLPGLATPQPITLINTVPSVIAELLRAGAIPPSVGTINLAGEPLPAALVRQIYEQTTVERVFDLYGPSEDTTYSTCALRRPDSTATIGRPIANTRIYLLDANGQPVPIGVPGEIYIGGAGLARGYLNQPDLTAERFVPSPFAKNREPRTENQGSDEQRTKNKEQNTEKSAQTICNLQSAICNRLYRTGDLARYLPDGSLEFLGRIDQQVKVRGFRIELGEIEMALRQHPAVREAIVLARADGGGKRLVAYIVPTDHRPPTTDDWSSQFSILNSQFSIPGSRALGDFLRQKLPEYMVPAAFVFLDALPLMPNGKVDRRALPAPDRTEVAEGAGYVAPRDHAEEVLASIWSQVLGVPQVGIHDNFFALGGDSIISIQIIARASQLGLRLTPRQIFQHQTIAELARVAGQAPAAHAEQGSVTGSMPLTPIQRWFFEHELPERQHWNQAVLLEVRDRVDPALLERAFERLIAQHDSLRLRFEHGADGWWQYHAAPGGPIAFSYVSLAALPKVAQTAQMAESMAAVQASLDLANGPLLRAVLFDLGAGRPARLLIVIHHLAIDGVSWRILLDDFQALVEAALRGEEARLPPKTTSFKAWAVGLAQYVRTGRLQPELDAWLTASPVRPPRLPLDFPAHTDFGLQNEPPIQNPKSKIQSPKEASARTVSIALDAEETHALLHEVPAAYRAQINDVMMTALAQAFAPWINASALLVDLEGHGREELWDGLDLSRTVGWFTAIFPVLLGIERGAHPVAALKATKEQLSYIPRRGIGYGLLRYLGDQDLAAKLRALPQAEISFNYLGQFDNTFDERALFRLLQEPIGPLHSPRGQRFHLIEVTGQVADGRLRMDWVYSEHLHRRETIETLAEGFMAALRTLIGVRRTPHASGYTPADFPLAQLDQPALDRIVEGSRDAEDIYPLAPGQHAMLAYALRDPSPGIYTLQWRCTLHGAVNGAALQQAWQRVVERHAVLRTGFAWEGLAPLQIVHRHAALHWQQHDLRGLTSTEQQQQLDALLAGDQARGFDLARAPLLRLMLVQMADERYHFCWSYHHLLLDGWSVAPLLREVLTLYDMARGADVSLIERAYLGYERRRRKTGPLGSGPHLPTVRSFRDYIAWLGRQDQAAAESFWRGYLGGATTFRLSMHARHEQGYVEQQRRLPAAATAALRTLAQRGHVTLNTLVQGAKALLLSRYSGREEVIFGVTVAGRPAGLEGVETIVGPFINTLPLRMAVPPGEPLLPWLRRLQAQQAELAQFEHTPLAQALEWAGLAADEPLFETILRFQNYPLDSSLWQRTGLEIRDITWFDRWHYPISFVVEPGAELTLGMTYDRRRFGDRQIARMLEQMQMILEQFVTDSDRTLGELFYPQISQISQI